MGVKELGKQLSLLLLLVYRKSAHPLNYYFQQNWKLLTKNPFTYDLMF